MTFAGPRSDVDDHRSLGPLLIAGVAVAVARETAARRQPEHIPS